MSSQKRKRSEESTDSFAIFRSEPIEDRSSTFIGYFSPSLRPKELQNLGEFSNASHKILAWRRESNQQAITGSTKYVTGHDDDGEKYGGKKVEKVLESMQVSGVCVVARWYGGVLLGPVRFAHIENCAKGAVRRWQGFDAEQQVKKRKEEEDANEKPKLVEILSKRDESIAVLRKLAAEKEDEVKSARISMMEDHGDTYANGEMKGHQTNPPETKASIEYDKMSVDRLKTLEKARDATLSFLLKRIDKAEAELASLEIEEPELQPR